MDRTDQVYLDPAIARCIVAAGCIDHLRCARAQATIGPGTPLGDYSFNRVKGEPCKHFEPIRRKLDVEPARPSVKPWPGGES